MSKMIKAWKDEDFRLSLSDEERALLPENPAGVVELTDEALDELVQGGREGHGSCALISCFGRTAALAAQ